MNTTIKALSPYLKAITKQSIFDEETLEQANELPTAQLQEQALDRYREEKNKLMKKIVCEMLDQASGKIISQSLPVPSPPVSIPVVAPPVQTPTFTHEDLLKAMREDLLDRYFPYMGQVGYVIRNHISQAWQTGKKISCTKWAVALVLLSVLWSPFWYAIRSPFRWVHHLWKHHSVSVVAMTPTTLRATPTGIPIPQIVSASLTSGNKLILRWNSVGDGYSYRLVRSIGDNEPTRPLKDGQTVNTPGAIVNVYAGDEKVTLLAVMAVNPQGQESELSQPVRFDLKPWNTEDSIESLAITPTVEVAASAPVNKTVEAKPKARNISKSRSENVAHAVVQVPKTTAPPAATTTTASPKPNFINNFARHLVGSADAVVASAIPIAPLAEGINATKNAAIAAHDETASSKPVSVPIPSGLRVEKQPDNYVLLTWESVGAGYRYNYYSAFAGQPTTYEIENNSPLTRTQTPWRPYDTTKAYWVVVTAVDASGHESARSNYVLVDLR